MAGVDLCWKYMFWLISLRAKSSKEFYSLCYAEHYRDED